MAARRGGRFDIRTLTIAGALIWLAWVAGTAAGVIGGSAIGDPDARDRRGPGSPVPGSSGPSSSARPRGWPALLGAGIALGLAPSRRTPDHRRGFGGPHRAVAPMSAGWLTVLAVGAATIAIKAAGPVLLGGRRLRRRRSSRSSRFSPAALLAPLVVVLTFQADGGLVVDGQVVGVAVGAVAIWRGVPVLLVVILAGAATAVARAFGVA